MKKFGEVLFQERNAKEITLKKAAKKLLIKEEHLTALEKEDWDKLPEPAFVKGYIKSYSQFLGLESGKMISLYRREFDESKSKKTETYDFKKTNFITPTKIRLGIFIFAIFAFITYIAFQYSSVFSSPQLDIFQPPDDVTVSVSIIEINGKAEEQSQVSIDGDFVPIDHDGNFSYFYNLNEGKNVIEIIASKRLSPKTRLSRTVRLLP